MLVINHLTKQYGTEFALQDVTIRLGKGMHFIVGASGSGKTTLLKILSGMEGDFEGEVSYNGKPMEEFSTKEKSGLYHSEFGFVWQDFHLLEEATALQNVLLPAGLGGSEKSAQSVLRQMKLEDLQHQKVKNLSGGQKQRVAIAREMMKNPKVIFCDEPTSALDGKSTKIVMDILHVLAKRRTVIVVTHDTAFIGKNDAVYELDKGELVSAPENQPGKVPAYQPPAFPRLSAGSALTLAARNLKNNVGRFLISALALVVSGTLLLTTFNGVLSKSGQGEFDRLVDTYGENILDIDLVGSFLSASGTGGTQEEKPNGDVDQDIGGLYEKYQADSRVAFLVTMQAFEDIQVTLEGKSYTVEKSGNSPVLTKLLSGTIPAGEDFQVVIPLKLAEKMGLTPETALGKTMDFSASVFQWQGNTPIPKPVKLTATICGVADNTVVYDYEGQHSSFTVDDSFFFNRSAIEEIRSQAGISDKSANFTMRAKTPEDLISLKDELNKMGIVPLGRFELVEDIVRLNQQTARQSGSAGTIIALLSVLLAVLIFAMTALLRMREYAIYKVTGYAASHLAIITLGETLFSATGAAVLFLALSPLLNLATKTLFAASILSGGKLLVGVLLILAVSLAAWAAQLPAVAAASCKRMLQSGDKT